MLICAGLFPCLTVLFATGLPAILGVLGWLLPGFVIAYYATLPYGDTGPFLVAAAGVSAVLCLLGRGSEAVSQNNVRKSP